MEHPKRKAIRLREFDYASAGAYFVTVCTHQRKQTLSTICRGDPCGRPSLHLSVLGKIVNDAFSKVEAIYDVKFDCRVIMPNHVHFILFLSEQRATARVAPTLGRVVGAYKSIAANEGRPLAGGQKIWQRGYYEHVIRNAQNLYEIRKYIDENHIKWAEDEYFQ